MKCRRCPAEAAPGRSRCPSCSEKERRESAGKYAKKGGWGGLRHRGPARCGDCGKLGHKSTSHRNDSARLEREGKVIRIICPRCNARISGTFDDEQAAEILAQHRHRPPRRRREEGRAAQLDLSSVADVDSDNQKLTA